MATIGWFAIEGLLLWIGASFIGANWVGYAYSGIWRRQNTYVALVGVILVGLAVYWCNYFPLAITVTPK